MNLHTFWRLRRPSLVDSVAVRAGRRVILHIFVKKRWSNAPKSCKIHQIPLTSKRQSDPLTFTSFHKSMSNPKEIYSEDLERKLSDDLTAT